MRKQPRDFHVVLIAGIIFFFASTAFPKEIGVGIMAIALTCFGIAFFIRKKQTTYIAGMIFKNQPATTLPGQPHNGTPTSRPTPLLIRLMVGTLFGLIALCVLGATLQAITTPTAPQPTATVPARAAAIAIKTPTDVPTEIPATPTRQPTNTPTPTASPTLTRQPTNTTTPTVPPTSTNTLAPTPTTPAKSPTSLPPTLAPLPTSAPIQPTVKPAATNPPAQSSCPNGCVSQIPGCLIKGNISDSKEKIFHVPGGASYNATIIDPSKGERWFCTESEAVANGWRKALK